MSLTLDLHPNIIDNMRQSALHNGWTGGAREAANRALEGIFGGKAAYILLVPAPSQDVVDEIRHEVNKILNRETSLIYAPKSGDIIG